MGLQVNLESVEKLWREDGEHLRRIVIVHLIV